MLIEAPELSGLKSVRHAFFTREGGVSSGIYTSLNGGLGSSDTPDNVQENRRRMAECLGVTEPNLVSLYQIHSDKVVVAETPWGAPRPQADAMVTKVPGIALGISTADCGPVLFVDPHHGVIGAAHAGWKGAIGGILEATIAEMEKLGAERRTITAVLGPCISQKNYEVGSEFRDRFIEKTAENSRYFNRSSKDGYFLFDLKGYIAGRMVVAEIGNFHDLGLCTYADEQRFFSFRRATHRQEPDYGRQISAICLTDASVSK
ncbi:peptidoglycan editing factor PgeF [Microvirga sp. W0021]|uniref:Purine nucleoside phosphorylase n=1 Tax=Hohaiivirga grylli TaxID=3133970 RepID=A0ABV0BN58_9HYPH